MDKHNKSYIVIYDDGELDKSPTVANFATTASDGKIYKNNAPENESPLFQ